MSDVRRLEDDALSDDELTALALSADPDAPLHPEAMPIDFYLGTAGAPALPAWYMAPARARIRRKWGRALVVVLVGAFLLIEAFGLCSTYGQPPFH